MVCFNYYYNVLAVHCTETMQLKLDFLIVYRLSCNKHPLTLVSIATTRGSKCIQLRFIDSFPCSIWPRMDQDSDRISEDKFIAALDIGTTTIRCIIFDQSLHVRGSAHDEVQLLYPQPGRVEIEPEDFWQRIRSTIQRSIRDAELEAHEIAGLGISTQRSTFICWDRLTGRPYHNFITWKDLRADHIVTKWNSSFVLKVKVGVFVFQA